ncbi:MAG: carboxy terminal-processing peptidase [Flavobacterium sp.]|nr:carboxy terminal-processing peptidase [Flavobacterium sp.]
MRKIFLCLLLFSFSLFGQNGAKTCEILNKINTLMQREHYHPKPIDDSLSVFVFDTFMDRLDINRNIFTKDEYKKLSKHRLQLDNYITDNDCTFLKEFVSTYKTALERKKAIIEKIQKIPFDYTTNDSVKFSKKNFPFDLNEADIERNYKKRLRFDILEDISKTSTNLDSLKQNFTALETLSRKKIFETTLCKINGLLESKEDMETSLSNDFLDIFCNYYDPHSNYFPLETKTSFMSSLSTNNLSLGMDLSINEKDEIVVKEVIPGGPAAKSKKIEKDDIIVKASNGKGIEYWVSCASLETIGEMIFSDGNKNIEFTIRKKNGSLLDVALKKQIMKATDNNVTSFIAEKGVRVGYISLPSFYSDFDGNNVHGCADDVAKEIVKLQKDNIDGLVIDLQDNGGGSMEEAIKLAGMFIDYGPVSVLSDNKNKQTILKDQNRGSVYNGPLVLLINGNSASASEFFAAAMQDYSRAFVVGATSLGKASMQVILPVDDKNQQDFAKVTIQKFYRITGDSNQIKGIIPDVPMPVLFDSIVEREKNYKTALPYDQIVTKAKFQKYYASEYNDQVIAQSRDRIKTNARCLEMEKINNEINVIYNNTRPSVRLTFVDVYKEIHDIDVLWKKVKQITSKPTECKIMNTSYEKDKIQFDALLKEINSYKIKDVQSNPYLEEAVGIIKDYNKLKKATD